jgi:hypothetical protein
MSGFTDRWIALNSWSELSGISTSELHAAVTAFQNTVSHNIMATEDEFGDRVWRMDELWEKVLKVPDPEIS